jgi:hypothetical protein
MQMANQPSALPSRRRGTESASEAITTTCVRPIPTPPTTCVTISTPKSPVRPAATWETPPRVRPAKSVARRPKRSASIPPGMARIAAGRL